MSTELKIKISTTADVKAIQEAIGTIDGIEKVSKTASKEIDNTSSRLDRMASSVKTLIAGYIGFNIVKSSTMYFIEQADSMKLLDARLKLTSASITEYHSQQKELLQIAKETHSSLQDETNLYVKLNVPLKALHATTMQVNAVTESFTKGLKIGGAATSEASSATLQFAQAMASGVLRGDEFNSIAENSPKLMEYMAKGMGVPQTALRQMAENGELSAGRVANALLKMTSQINSDFKQMPITVGQSMTDLKTELSLTIEEFDKAHGITTTLAGDIEYVANNLDDFIRYTKDATLAAGALYGGAIAVDVIKDIRLAMGELTLAQYAFNTAAKLNPYMIIATAGVGIATYLYDQKQQVQQAFDDQVKATKQAHDEYNKNLTTEDGKVQQLGMSYNSLADSIVKLKNSSAPQAVIASLEAQQKRIQQEAMKYNGVNTTGIITSSPLKQSEIEKQNKAAEALKQSYLSINKDIANLSGNEHDKVIANINDQAEKYRKAKVDEVTISKLTSAAMTALNKKELVELGSAMTSARTEKEKEWSNLEAKDTQQTLKRWEDSKSALIEYYTTIDDKSNVFTITESDRMQKLAESGILSNEQMLAIWEKDNEKFQKTQWEKDNQFWVGLFDNINKAMGDQFFNAMTGKFNSFGSWLKDMWSSITQSMARGLSKSLADSIIGTGTSNGGIQN
ncbi:MAG: tape measure protein, partial [Sulfuricurvum sp.]|nr:tape measure protein [Sulfuricurvum sp.]